LRNIDEESEDEMFNRLIYLQAADEVITGNIPVLTDEEEVIMFATKAFAIAFADEFPEDADGLVEAEMMKYVPVSWRSKYSDTEWANHILAKRSSVIDEDADSLQTQVVDRVREHELYGTHFFHVKKANDVDAISKLPTPHINDCCLQLRRPSLPRRE
jgi:hypothetical protein